jgi:uncharacterized membrane protein
MGWLISVLTPLRELANAVFPFIERMSAVRIVLGSALAFFLPGFAWSFVFFKKLNIIERIALSIALSIVIVTLVLVFINRVLGASLTGFNSVIAITGITILAIMFYYLNRFIDKRRSKTTHA